MITEKVTVSLEIAPMHDAEWEFEIEIDEDGGIYQEKSFGYEYVEYVDGVKKLKAHRICFSKFNLIFPPSVGNWVMRELKYYASTNPADKDYYIQSTCDDREGK
jgi:hypothetical protein